MKLLLILISLFAVRAGAVDCSPGVKICMTSDGLIVKSGGSISGPGVKKDLSLEVDAAGTNTIRAIVPQAGEVLAATCVLSVDPAESAAIKLQLNGVDLSGSAQTWGNGSSAYSKNTVTISGGDVAAGDIISLVVTDASGSGRFGCTVPVSLD